MEILEIAKKVKQKGGKLYLVGGALRDELLGRKVHDKDYCVVGLNQEEWEQLFPEAHKRGKFFCVYDIEGTEFALARKEKKEGKGHTQFSITTGKEITIEEDLARRDITINAMAKEIETGKLIDPYNGKKDLENKIIRATSKAFCEDPLRVYRVARFAAMLGFEVEENTIVMMKKLKQELNTLSVERVFDEFRKALSTDKPSIFFEVLKKAEVLDVHFKEIYDLIGSTQPEKYHPEGDSFAHTMMVVDKSAQITDNLEIRFSCLVHDLGKGITPKEMLPHHYGHDKNGVSLVVRFGKRLKMPEIWIKCGKTAAREHILGGIFTKMTAPKQVDFLERVSKSKLGLDGMKIVVLCDRWRENEMPKDITFDKLGKECFSKINGKYIEEKYHIKNTKEVGELLRNERIEWLKKENKECGMRMNMKK